MTDYQLKVTKTAQKSILRLPGHVRQRARRIINSLATTPHPSEALELDLPDLPGRYRIRLEKWRIIYRVDEDTKTVTIQDVRLKTGPETYGDIE
ncbi:MAG TPA: type II toxin-antitoxin system RelE/ParE family toxin [Ardenticatenaceae bacterium]|jgi:mRNA-degrading endonuclease RelE of RelBE toxin-antitoxin system